MRAAQGGVIPMLAMPWTLLTLGVTARICFRLNVSKFAVSPAKAGAQVKPTSRSG
jgi:hypothetical protein